MKTVNVTITGINPLLIHRFVEQDQQQSSSRKVKIETSNDTRLTALSVANRRPDGTHYISSFALVNAMCSAGSNYKMKGSRKSVKFIVPSAVRIQTTDCTTTILVKGEPATDVSFEVDARPVTIPATKGRIMRYRPRYENWSMKFELGILDDLVDVPLAHQLLTDAGIQIGIGDFRPEKRGPFGTFRVTSWEEQ
jgi:hypothetical protein